MRILTLTVALLLLAVSNIYGSGVFPLDNPSKLIIGVNRTYTIQDDETLIKLAREYDVGFNEIAAANSNSDPWVPDNGSRIIIPTSWLLPEILDDGLIINLAEMRLYYFFILNNRKYVTTYPIGIGRQGFNTPTGIFRVTLKVKDPVWHVPDNIREENPELPAFVPPGPDNPLGGYWLQLSVNGYGIHGTNRPYGIGRRVSHGCIRLYPEDIKTLFKFIKPGTPVKILNEPVKTGMYNNKVYIEVHRSGIEDPELMMLAVKNLGRKRLLKYVDTQLMIHAIKSATGLPAVISR
ncbi:MAG TPA: LysM peptidoglycan-binding domain-containing protein [Nitrospirae bacterium]|nr:putative L,D-transpeptidase YcfS precursor [bacterium BMS3Abin06]HDH12695.1 LysM peptidoglycan-binding domain-containing protein [Nitrospirota bacterium]HDZ00004.1 LysM peptidoglycan-binding domain-containing protein [Nitrospirota bacterium]